MKVYTVYDSGRQWQREIVEALKHIIYFKFLNISTMALIIINYNICVKVLRLYIHPPISDMKQLL